jgi:hypothetical protein
LKPAESQDQFPNHHQNEIMGDHIDDTLALLKTNKIPEKKWDAFLKLCRKNEKSGVWDQLPEPRLAKDIAATQKWLDQELSKMPKATGIYLGLDTLNMSGAKGFNLEIGGSTKAESSTREVNWIYECSKYGKRHLIGSLRAFNRVYMAARWEEISSHADYLLPLGYSGLVLGAAIENLTDKKDRVFAWGFHDGDMFLLGRRIGTKFTPEFCLTEE